MGAECVQRAIYGDGGPIGARAKAMDVDAFLEALEHPRKAEVLALRRVILQSADGIQEAVKWNAPSFFTAEHFATMNLRDKNGVGVIMHFGAKKRGSEFKPRVLIPDPTGMLTWLADDRAVISFRDLRDIETRGDAFAALIREWVKQV